MERLDGHDELLARIARIDPATVTPALSDGALSRVTRSAMAPSATPWTWGRLRLASLGALVGSSALVVAGILGIQAAAPDLPVLALGPATAASSSAHAPRGSSTPSQGMMIPYLSYQFTVGPDLSSSGGSATAYELVSGVDAATAAAQIARYFGVVGPVVSTSDGSYQVGPDAGPSVSTGTSSGVVNWWYDGSTPTATTGTVGPTGSTPPPADPTLPSDAKASTDAVALLGAVGVDGSALGVPRVDSSSGTEVDVTVPFVVASTATDQTFSVDYGTNDAVLTASGILATATPSATYPTISPTDAVNVLVQDHGFVFYGGVAPMAGVAPTPSAGASGSSSGAAPTDPSTTGPAVPPSTTDTTVPPSTTDTTVPGPPVVNVEIDDASLQLGTYTLTDGTTWLLATWALSGPESGTTMSGPQTYSANVLAIDPRYVQLQAHPIVF